MLQLRVMVSCDDAVGERLAGGRSEDQPGDQKGSLAGQRLWLLADAPEQPSMADLRQ
jgi:hypothetical protein